MRGFILIILIFMIFPLPAQIKNPRGVAYTWETDTSKHTIPLSELTLVVPRNTFPAIDYPDFLGKNEGSKAFFIHEPVISVEINGEAKAYPLNMLTMHEMSNDSLGGIPILPTYCPLCNASVVYDRRLSHEGKEYLLEFEVSGMLRNSDMVMADKQTQSWWQQLIGQGIVGELAGADLNIIPSLVISVEEFFERYPDGLILSPRTGTGSEPRYGLNPYEGYDNGANKPYEGFFDHAKLDDRLLPMERVIDIKGASGYKIYPFSKIAEKGVINDSYGGKSIVIFYKEGTVSVLDHASIAESRSVGSATVFSANLDGEVLSFKKRRDRFIDEQTGSKWDITGHCIEGELKGKSLKPERHSNHFAFAWLSFFPDSEIFE